VGRYQHQSADSNLRNALEEQEHFARVTRIAARSCIAARRRRIVVVECAHWLAKMTWIAPQICDVNTRCVFIDAKVTTTALLE
jgi:hypothetical protein